MHLPRKAVPGMTRGAMLDRRKIGMWIRTARCLVGMERPDTVIQRGMGRR